MISSLITFLIRELGQIQIDSTSNYNLEYINFLSFYHGIIVVKIGIQKNLLVTLEMIPYKIVIHKEYH